MTDPAPSPPRRLSRAAVLRAAAGVPALALVACSQEQAGPGPDPSASASPSGSPSERSTGGPSSTPSGRPSSSASASSTSAPEPAPSADPGAPGPVSVRVAGTLASGLVVPWGIAFLPDGDALVSSRDTGHVLRVGRRGGVRRVGTVPGVVSKAEQGGEGGLLGLALHPRFPARPWLYAYRTTTGGNEVVRMRWRGDGLGRPQVVLDGIAASIHHNGGALAFGPDGHLYVSTGDGEVPSAAQDASSLNGKVLRVSATGRVPRGNPGGRAAWSLGHRNVEGLAFDGGDLWASEFGEKTADELNRVVRGANYGWPRVEGDSGGRFRDPLLTWDTDACSPAGVTVAAGRAWLGALQGQCLYAVRLRGPRRGTVERFLTGRFGRIRLVAAAPDGSVWVGTSNRDGRATPGPQDDRLLRITL